MSGPGSYGSTVSVTVKGATYDVTIKLKLHLILTELMFFLLHPQMKTVRELDVY